MLRQVEGSRAVAEAVAACRPDVVCAYPISPQTHIVEALSQLVKCGELSPCEYVNVESEFAAMSVAIGSSATGARTFTATASQGLLFMVEAVYNASGLGLPIVMTVANRAIGAPINIWNDHSDAMSQRDSGWMQLYARTNQEAADLHVQAFRLAEELSLPVMVCMDGFILTHAVERVDIPDRRAGRCSSCRPSSPAQLLDPAEPVSIGAMVGPEAFTEVRYLAHAKQMQALDRIPADRRRLRRACSVATPGAWCIPYSARTPRRSSSRWTRCSARSRTSSTSSGSADGGSVPSASARSARSRSTPFGGARRGRPASSCSRRRCRSASAVRCRPTCGCRCPGCSLRGYTVIAGLGGRPITRASLHDMLAQASPTSSRR